MDLIANAMRNAKESLARKMADSATQTKLLAGIADNDRDEGIQKRIGFALSFWVIRNP